MYLNNTAMESLIKKYKELGIDKTIDHDKFNLISVVHHSTVLEGSTWGQSTKRRK